MKYFISRCVVMVITSGLILSTQGFSSVNEIAIIAVDNNGVEKLEIVKANKLGEKMSRLISEVNETVSQQMSGQNFRAGGFKLKKISLGLGLSGEFGIGPWSIGGLIRHRILFKKN